VHAAVNRFEESLAVARRQRDDLGAMIALHHLGWARLLLGRTDQADAAPAGDLFAESLGMAVRLGHDEGIAYGLEGLVAVAATAGDVEHAGVLLGAAERLRAQTGIYNAPAFSFHQGYADALLAGPAAGDFGAARRRGAELTTEEAVAAALSGQDVAA
jgi:hypothetical protein